MGFFTAFRMTNRGLLRRLSTSLETPRNDNKMKSPMGESMGLLNLIRQRPTLPQIITCSTIGAEGLNFRVRNGIGCIPLAIATGKRSIFLVQRRPSEAGELRKSYVLSEQRERRIP